MFLAKIALLYFLSLVVLTLEDEEGSLLSKFHQTDYKLKYERMEVEYFDKKFFKRMEAANFKFNRSHPASNLSMEFKVDLNYDLQVLIRAFKFLSNEYRAFPIHFQEKFCNLIDYNVMGIKQYLGDMVMCPLKKNILYQIKNFYPNESMLPPLIPSGQFKISMTYIYMDEEFADSSFFATVYRPIPIPKKK